jgi:DNA polymerase (family 10)
MTDQEKKRWTLDFAYAVALEIVDALHGSCERIAIAGSLRRRKPDVGDVEILYIPKFQTMRDGLFDMAQIDIAERCIDNMLACGFLRKRPSIKGTFAWGEKNKLGIHAASGMPVDLFATTEDCWHNYMVCRTGPKASNQRIAITAQKQNHTWHPYGTGFESNLTGQTFAMHSEEEVFAFVGLPYAPPEKRE